MTDSGVPASPVADDVDEAIELMHRIKAAADDPSESRLPPSMTD